MDYGISGREIDLPGEDVEQGIELVDGCDEGGMELCLTRVSHISALDRCSSSSGVSHSFPSCSTDDLSNGT